MNHNYLQSSFKIFTDYGPEYASFSDKGINVVL